VIDFFAGQPEARHLVARHLSDGIVISIITYTELLDGILGSRDVVEGEEQLREFLTSISVLGISRPVARRAAVIRRELRRSGRQVGHRLLDLFIAATALHHGLTLVTRNTRDYADVAGLAMYQQA
jgi:predicted nucleic acid-binding protein